MNIHAMLVLADSYQAAGIHEDAERCWREVLAARPDHPVALAALAMLLRADGRVAEVLPLLRRLIAVAPDQPGHRVALAEALGMLDRHEEAVFAWREVLTLTPDDNASWLELARQRAFTGDRDGAIGAAATVLSREPTSTKARRLLELFLQDASRAVERFGPEPVIQAVPAGGKRPLNVLWRRAVLEKTQSEWTDRVLLARLGRPVRVLVHEDDAQRPYLDDCLVPVLDTAEAASWFLEARRRGHRNLGLYHMGDEYGAHDVAVYRDADWVIRNYWRSKTDSMWVPTGWRNGVGGTAAGSLLPIAQRGLTAVFAGGIGSAPERLRMLDVIERYDLPVSIHKTSGSGRGYGPAQYAALLGNSRFALLPAGNVPEETIRLYDCLEMGCIPLVPNAPRLRPALGNPPFPDFPSWDYLPEVLKRDWSEAQDTADQIQEWWRAYKLELGGRVSELVNRSFAESA